MGLAQVRSAAAASYWRAIQKSPKRLVELRRFSYGGLAGLLDDSITFSAPITAICGLSGAGKSAILRAIWATLDWESASQRVEVTQRLAGANFEAILAIDENEETAEIIIDAGVPISTVNRPLQILHLDPSILAAALQQKLCSLQSLPELLDAYEPIELTSDEVEMISFISKKEYRSIKIFEIDEFEDEQILPNVQIDDGRFSYNSRTMSLGEISILLCFWTLRRAQEGAILLAEEPETYISPSSQAALIDYLAYASVTKKISIIFTTHSPEMVSRLSDDQIRFFCESR